MKAIPIVLGLLLSSWAAVAQETVALSIEGWSHGERNGVFSFRCTSSICADGSAVSYKRQPHRPALTLADFERHHQHLAGINRGTASIREVRLTAFQERTVEGVRVFSVLRTVEWRDGSATFSVDSLLTGPTKSYTVLSDARRPEWALRNFDGFLPRLVDFALLQGP